MEVSCSEGGPESSIFDEYQREDGAGDSADDADDNEEFARG